MKYIIKDWTGRNIYPGLTFNTFDDGWAYVIEHSPESDWQDIYVEVGA